MRKNLFVKEAERVCYTEEGDSGGSNVHRNPSMTGSYTIALEAAGRARARS